MAIWVAKQKQKTNQSTKKKKKKEPHCFIGREWKMKQEEEMQNGEWHQFWCYVLLNFQAFPKCIGKKLGQNNLRVQIFLVLCSCCLGGTESNSSNNESVATRTAPPCWYHCAHSWVDVPCLHGKPGRHWRKHFCDWGKSSMQVTKAGEMAQHTQNFWDHSFLYEVFWCSANKSDEFTHQVLLHAKFRRDLFFTVVFL